MEERVEDHEDAPTQQVALSAKAAPTLRRRLRQTAVVVLLVLSCLGILTSSLAIWLHSTLLNTDHWVQLVGPAGHDPQVIDALSAYTADQIVILLDVQGRTAQTLPFGGQFLAPSLTQLVRNSVQGRVADAMRSDAFQTVWIQTNRYAHQQIVAALRGQQSAVTITNGAAYLDLLPVIAQGLRLVQQQVPSLISDRITIPAIGATQPPDQARRQLGQALGVTIPADFGMILLFQGNELTRAQFAVQAFDADVIILPILTALLMLLTLLLAQNRRRTLFWLGIGAALSFVLAKLLVNYLQSTVIADIANPTAHALVAATLPRALADFGAVTTWLLIAGLALALVAFLAGKPQWFRALSAQAQRGYAWVRAQITKRRAPTPSAPGQAASAS